MSSKLALCPHCGGDLAGADDGRAGWWSFRVRLYDMELNRTEPMVDSDADLEPDQPGAETVRGLWKVAHESALAAGEFHGCALRGLSGEVLERKVRGLRPTLSRNNGKATMRVPYDTAETFTAEGDERYLMRVDIAKVDSLPASFLAIPEPDPFDQEH